MKHWTKSIQVNVREVIRRVVPSRAGKRQKDPRYRQALRERREIEVRKELNEIEKRPFQLLDSDDTRRRALRRELSRLSRSPILIT
jgi:hypothetical protein